MDPTQVLALRTSSVQIQSDFKSVRSRVHVIAMLVTLLALFNTDSSDADDWDEIKRWLPPSSNAVLAIDAKGLFDSPLARKQNWRQSHAQDWARNPTMLPPNAERFVLAADLNLEYVESMHDTAVISSREPVSLKEIMQRVPGEIDHIANIDVIRTNRGSFVVPVANNQVVVIRMSQRQFAAQQIQQGRTRKSPQLEEILEGAINNVAAGNSQIALAVRLADAIPQSEIVDAVGRSPLLQQLIPNANQVAIELSTLEGVVFLVRVDEGIQGKLMLQFREKPTAIVDVATPFIREILQTAGADLPEFEHWEACEDPRSLGLTGELSVAGLRRVLSLLNPDSSTLEMFRETEATSSQPTPQPSKNTTLTSAEKAAKATERYVAKITEMVEHLSAGAQKGTLNNQLLWADRNAKTIARLSTKNVDPRAVEFARQIAYGLSDIVSTFGHAADTAVIRAATEAPNPTFEWENYLVPYYSYVTPYGRYYRYTPWSYAHINLRSTIEKRRLITYKEMVKANEKAKQIFDQVEETVEKLKGTVR